MVARRAWNVLRATGLALSLLVAPPRLLAAASRTGRGPALPKGATLVFGDAFDRAELGAYGQGNVDPAVRARLHWCVRRGTWAIRREPDGNGFLHGAGGPAVIVVEKPLGANFRLEYTAWSPHPGDRSAFLCVPRANFRYHDIYGFHFAGGYSKYSLITRLGRPMTDNATSLLPRPGQRCRVVIQKTDARLAMFVDGQPLFAATDANYAAIREELATGMGTRVGLYTWSDGMCFDDLKVFALPGRGPRLAKAARVERSLWQGFEAETPGEAPRGATVHAGPSCSARVADEPTVVYHPKPTGQKLTRDLCVELKDPSGKPGATASVTVAFPAIRSGEVEAELLAWSHTGACAEVAVVGEDGSALAAVLVDAAGRFVARTPAGTRRLRDRISYKNRPPDGPFYLQPKRWFTVRLSFDADAGVYDVAVVNLYAGLRTPGIAYFPLGTGLPMLARGPACGLKVSTADAAHVLVDNVCMASPRAAKLNGMPRTQPLRTILGLAFPLRVDPVSLSVHGLRNECGTCYPQEALKNRHRRPPTPPFRQAAIRYNRLLVRHALLDERAQRLARMAYHLAGTRGGQGVPAQARDVVAHIRQATTELEAALRCFGNAFRDAVNEQRLGSEFPPIAQALEGRLTTLETQAEAAAQACVAAAGGKLEPAPPLAPGPYEAPLEWANGRFERGGQPTCFYPPVGCKSLEMLAKGDMHKLLGLDNCFGVPFLLDRAGQADRADTQSFPWDVFGRFAQDYVLKGNPSARMGVQSEFGCIYLRQYCPAWWLERHKADPDIFFMDEKGRNPHWPGADAPYQARTLRGGRYAGGGGYHARLNFWHPAVRAMYRTMLESWGEHMHRTYPGRPLYFAVGLEGNNFAGTITGLNPSAVEAFRAHLKQAYKSIEALNAAWGTTYASFEAIDPRRQDIGKPGGLTYEFQRFRQTGYWDWMKLMKSSLKKHLPGLVFLNDFHNAGDWPVRGGLDVPSMFRTYDVVGNHYYGVPAAKAVWVHRLLDSLRKAYGTALGNFEWAAGVRNGDIFSEPAHKADGQLGMFEQLAWGRSVLAVWYGWSAGFAEGAQYTCPLLGGDVLRYSTGYIPVGRLRSRRFGAIALTCPTVTPKLAILESTTSFLNAIDCRATRAKVCDALDGEQWNYGFVFDDVLLEGKQSLAGIRTLIAPRALCLKPEVSTRLLAWVHKGGTLVAILPPGIHNQYGRPHGELCRSILGDARIALNAEFTQATVEGMDDARVTAEPTGQRDGTMLTARYGAGRLCLYTSSAPFPDEHLLKVVARHTPRDVWTAAGRFRLVLRESERHLYLFVVNPDLYATTEDVVLLAGRHPGAVDLGCAAAFPVRATMKDDETRLHLHLRLFPGEGTVLRVAK